ncbi:hypothetical protein BaRGS_00012304, partial [Batillaria attramentaria]
DTLKKGSKLLTLADKALDTGVDIRNSTTGGSLIISVERESGGKAENLLSSSPARTTDVDQIPERRSCECDDETFRLLLLGRTGDGKSSTGNTILDEDVFLRRAALFSTEKAPQFESRKKNGRIFEIMDCPGLCDTRDAEKVCREIVKAVACMHPGPHAILYVLKVGPYTEDEFTVYNALKVLFDEKITDHMIILFTHGDKLETERKTFKDFLKTDNELFLRVFEECGQRCLVFNNIAENKKPQVDELLEIVRVLKNNERPYACTKYEKIGEELQDEVAKRIRDDQACEETVVPSEHETTGKKGKLEPEKQRSPGRLESDISQQMKTGISKGKEDYFVDTKFVCGETVVPSEHGTTEKKKRKLEPEALDAPKKETSPSRLESDISRHIKTGISKGKEDYFVDTKIGMVLPHVKSFQSQTVRFR